MDAVWLAVVASTSGLLATLLTSVLASRAKREDYARQDKVAERVAEAARQAADAARLLVAAQEDTKVQASEVARLAAEANDLTQRRLTEIDEKSNKIHILVNSDMTAARTNERNQTVLLLASLENVLALTHKLEIEASPAQLEAIVAAKERITELDAILADRHAAQKRVDAAAKEEK